MIDLNHKFLGIYDESIGIAETLVDKYGGQIFSKGEDLLKLKPDILGTSAINNKKIDVLKICNDNNIHLMSDKPLVTTREGYNQLKSIVNQDKIKIGLMLTERFNPPIYTLKNLVDNGVLGDLISFNIIKPHKLIESTRADWHFSKLQNGGPIIDLLIHDIDLIRWFIKSDIKSFSSYLKKSSYFEYETFFDSAYAILNMDNGVTASLMADWWMPDSYYTYGDGRIFCVGTKGMAEIRTTGDFNSKGRPYGLYITNTDDYQLIDNIDNPKNLTEDFLDSINGNDNIISNHDILWLSEAIVDVDEGANKIILK